MAPSDHDLLREYARHASQAAFAELVRRHLDLVFSAARRQVVSSALAEEIAQSVFLDLSRQAARIQPGTPLVAWLHLVTRRTAIDAIRQESRRRQREQAALEIAAMKPTPSNWSELEPLLDEALGRLDEIDRSAVLLRYFENKNLREVGQALGLSDDAAQKRVSRALERLRQILSRRAVAATAAGLATEISLHAVQPAPAGFAATVSSKIALSGVATVKAALPIAQKLLIATAATVVVAAGLYQAMTHHQQEQEIARLETLSAGWEQGIFRLRGQRNEAASRAEKTAATRAAASVSDDPALDARLHALIVTVNKLKRRLDQNPQQQIPELRFLYDADWFTLAQKHAELATDDDYREALADLRVAAKTKFLPLLSGALKEYLKTSGGVLPADTTQLARFFIPPVDPAILQRYEMLAAGPVSALTVSKPPDHLTNGPLTLTLLKEKTSMIVDPGNEKWGGIDFQEGEAAISWFVADPTEIPSDTPDRPEFVALQAALNQAVKAYSAANSGKVPGGFEVEKLLPFFQDPEKGAKFLRIYKEADLRSLSDQLYEAQTEAVEAFQATHHGAESKDPLELASYFRKPEDGAQYYLIWKRRQAPMPK